MLHPRLSRLLVTTFLAPLVALLALGAACEEQPVFPDDAETTWEEVVDCRLSVEHELRYIRIFADASGARTYHERSAPFDEGAVLLKAEYEEDDCTGLIEFTAMQKLAAGSEPEAADWRWQKVSPEREILEDGAIESCISCHLHCGSGHDAACAELEE